MFHGGTTMPDPKVLGQTRRYFPRIVAIIELNASCRAACDGDLRSTIRALIVANEFLEAEVSELMKAVSHAYVRGKFQTYRSSVSLWTTSLSWAKPIYAGF
jgi:hypothetical protein